MPESGIDRCNRLPAALLKRDFDPDGLSVALQHGIPACALAKSIGRDPDGMGRFTVASAISAALDLIAEYEAAIYQASAGGADCELVIEAIAAGKNASSKAPQKRLGLKIFFREPLSSGRALKIFGA